MILDPLDSRDSIFACPPATAYRLPVGDVDLSRFCLPVEAQGRTKICTAAAVTEGCEMFYGGELSWPFNYWVSRELLDPAMLAYDSGGFVRFALHGAHQVGIPPDSLFPFAPDMLTTKPPQAAYDAALKLDSYARIDTTDRYKAILTMRYALASGRPLVMSLKCGAHFNELVRGEVYKPISLTNPLSYGHALLIVGYGGAFPEWFRFKNSQGSSWGDDGFGRMDVGVVKDAFDIWVLEGFNGISSVAPSQLRRSVMWEYADTHREEVRAYVSGYANDPQQIIDSCVAIGATVAEFERWMGYQAGDVLAYATAHPELDWSQWL
jgi:hypothetical protein